MDTVDWVISIVIGVFGIGATGALFILVVMELEVLRAVDKLGSHLEKITDKMERVELHLAATRKGISS